MIHRKLNAEGDTVTVPRDQHELYKEAAEKWARGQIYALGDSLAWSCKSCKALTVGVSRLETDDKHAANCKAAKILGLKREGEG